MKRLIFLFLFTIPLFAVNVGETAPDFTLTEYQGTSVSLSDFKGKVVYLFFLGYG